MSSFIVQFVLNDGVSVVNLNFSLLSCKEMSDQYIRKALERDFKMSSGRQAVPMNTGQVYRPVLDLRQPPTSKRTTIFRKTK